MADHRDGLTGAEEALDEPNSLVVRAQLVGVSDTTREHEPIEVSGRHVLDGRVDLEGVALVEMVERLDLSALQRNQLRRRAGFLDRFPRFGQLNLLGAFVAAQKCNRLARQFVSHGVSFRRTDEGGVALTARVKPARAGDPWGESERATKCSP